MTLTPMQQRVYDAIRSSGRIGISSSGIADLVGWCEPSHGPITDATARKHVMKIRRKGVVIESSSGWHGRYRLPAATLMLLGPIDFRSPFQHPVARKFLDRQPRHFGNDGKPIVRHILPLINRPPRDLAALGNRVHETAGLGDFLQSDASLSHTNLVSCANKPVKRLTACKSEGKENGKVSP